MVEVKWSGIYWRNKSRNNGADIEALQGRAAVVEVVEVKALGYRCDAGGKEDRRGG